MLIWDKKKKNLRYNGRVHKVNQSNSTTLYKVNGTDCYTGWILILLINFNYVDKYYSLQCISHQKCKKGSIYDSAI